MREQDPLVLLVEDDRAVRRMVHTALELEGARVVEAASLAEASSLLSADLAGIVLDRELPDGDGLDLLPEVARSAPHARVVVHSTKDDGREPAYVLRVDKGDTAALADLFGLATGSGAHDRLVFVDLVRAEAAAVAEDWAELCRWDPMLPPDCTPPDARRVVDAVTEAVQRPQPLGWGTDPALEHVVEDFALRVGDIDLAVGELICLREAVRRHVEGQVPPDEVAEAHARVDMVVDRAILAAARTAASRLRSQALADELTGLGNRRAFAADLDAEVARAARHGRRFALVALDVVGLKAVNESQGHPAGDRLLERMGRALRHLVREHDTAYRTGGDEFALLLPETDGDGARRLLQRLAVEAPAFHAGVAVHPDDGTTASTLVACADREMVADKRRSHAGPAEG